MLLQFPFITVSSQSEISENYENISKIHTHTENNSHTFNTHPEPHTSSGSKGRTDFYYSPDKSVFTKDTCSDSIVNSDLKIDSDNSDSEAIVIGDSDKEEIIIDVTNPYACDICEKSFVKESNLLDHKDTQHGYFSCRVRVPVCHAFFKQKSKLKKHYEIKHDRYCPHCYVYFSKYDELEQHVLEHAVADNNKFTCEKCSTTFSTKKKYQKHYNNKHAPYCPQCNKFFTTQSGYDQHVRDKHTQSGDKEVIIEDVGHDLGVDNNPNTQVSQ